MKETLVATLRSRPGIVRLGADGSMLDALSLRAQVPEVWDAIRIEAAKSASVLEVKRRALQVLLPDESAVEDYVVKLRGHEILDETASLESVGARDGSTLLITNRRRRPVK